MNATLTVAVVDPINSGSLYIDVLHRHGIDAVAIFSERGEQIISSYGKADTQFKKTFYQSKHPSVESLAQHIQANFPVNYIAIGHDAGIPIGDKLREILCPTYSNSSQNPGARWNKGDFRESLLSSKVPCLKDRVCKTKEEAIKFSRYFTKNGKDVVLKPLDSGGGDLVFRCATEEQVAESFLKIKNTRNLYSEEVEEILVQEFASGREIVANTVSWDGKHRIVDMFAYKKHMTKQGGFVYDSLEWIDPLQVDKSTRDYVDKCLNAVGQKFGVCHLELMESVDNVYLIELGCRPCGAQMPLLSRKVIGTSHIDEEIAHLIHSDYSPMPSEDSLLFSTVVFLSTDTSGTFSGESFKNTIERFPEVIENNFSLNEGDHVTASKDLSDSVQIGLIFIQSESRERGLKVRDEIQKIFRSSIV